MNSKTKKTEGVFTLGAFSYGTMRESGMVTTSDVEQSRLTFVESIFPIYRMIHEFQDWNLGTKIKVTMEVIDNG